MNIGRNSPDLDGYKLYNLCVTLGLDGTWKGIDKLLGLMTKDC